MIDIDELQAQAEKEIAVWEEALNDYSDEQLLARFAEQEWTLGQVYGHVLSAAQWFLRQASQCLRIQEQTDEGKNKTGEFVFSQGAFPERNIALPHHKERPPRQPVSKVVLRNGLEQTRALLREIARELPAASTGKRVQHPLFGMLHALEWYQLVAMHTRHHLRQKQRLDDLLGAG